jgi:hypothetical protein
MASDDYVVVTIGAVDPEIRMLANANTVCFEMEPASPPVYESYGRVPPVIWKAVFGEFSRVLHPAIEPCRSSSAGRTGAQQFQVR